MRIDTVSITLLLLLLLTGCFKTMHPVRASRDIPAGTILQDSDLEITGDMRYSRLQHPMSPPPQWTEDRSRVVGHQTLRPLHKHGRVFLMGYNGDLSQSDID